MSINSNTENIPWNTCFSIGKTENSPSDDVCTEYHNNQQKTNVKKKERN